MKLIDTIKKLLFPGETDRKVESINAESQAMREDIQAWKKSHDELMVKNNFSLGIYIGVGGNQRGH